MNRNKLESYAPEARRGFIQAVTDRAALYGFTAKMTEPMTEQGDVVIIAGRAFPKSVAETRKKLADRIKNQGFEQTIEAMAYTWFNRLVAIRYMELHGYLEHGYRVLSHPDGHARPEIVEHAEHVDLPGLDREKVIELKLDGTKEEELYRLLLLGQCHALHQAMPFLFEYIEDETELLLPDSLTKTDSLIRRLVEGIDESDWEQIEIIGWLYQFYISQKKDQVIGKVVKSEDIPAATQLFTPNWIVKYMVQNSLGAQWLATYPQSPLKGQMEYYIEPAEQTDEVNAQLAAITPSQLNPEELTLIDPASGSGHILVEAYELFKAIYLERGYRQRDVPQLILEKNLFGLDIDERAAQLTGFALMMKGRADDRRLFERGVKLNVMALVDSAGFDAERLAKGVELGHYGLKPGDLSELKRLFEHATTFGSLIQVPEGLAEKLPALKQLSEVSSQDLFVSDALKRLGPLVQQAQLLAAQYDAVVANPPYMGGKYHNSLLKEFLKAHFKEYKSNLFSAFVFRHLLLTKSNGSNAYVTPFEWLSISSFEALRSYILGRYSIGSLVKPSFTSFFDSAIVSLVTFVIEKRSSALRGTFFDLGRLTSSDSQARILKTGIETQSCTYKYISASSDFMKVPGSPVAFWASDRIREVFSKGEQLKEVAPAKLGMRTGDNDRWLRRWYEVPSTEMNTSAGSREDAKASGKKWFPYNKGGQFRRWFGNNEFLIFWADDGHEIKKETLSKYPELSWDNLGWKITSETDFFKPSLTWSFVSASYFGVRHSEKGAIFDVGGSSAFPEPGDHLWLAGFLCSKQVFLLLRMLNPTVNFQVANVAALPVLRKKIVVHKSLIDRLVRQLIVHSKQDWNAYERSWDFQTIPLLAASTDPTLTLESSYTAWITQNRDTIGEMKRLEEENNRLFIDAYGLAEELTPDVPIEQITLTVNPAYRYGGKLPEEEQWTRFRQDTMEELVSYAIGCMMGRYSLDAPGLIYAHSGNEGFDPSRYTTFPADDDGIVPLTDFHWFDDDASGRFERFIATVRPAEHLEENLRFVAESFGPKKGESSRNTIRGYLAANFFKHHLQTYKKRPIYWLFSSGKQRGFQALVYLHRYNEGTLSRMRTEYVVDLLGKIPARIDHLTDDIERATSSQHRKRLEKEKSTLTKQLAEVQAYDEKLRHYADQRITLDLDDGVKVNYGKFGDLLAEVKAVTGKKPV